MGVDACIYVKTRDGNEPELCDNLPTGCTVQTALDWACEGATTRLASAGTTTGQNSYERGRGRASPRC